MNSLDGKVALLSGAARGIGAETARKMAAAGASVVLGDVLADRVRETAKEITGEGGNALALSLDVTTREMKEGPSGSAVRCWPQAAASCDCQKQWW